MERDISEKRALQYDLIYLYVPNSEAIVFAMGLTDSEQKALGLNHARRLALSLRYAHGLTNKPQGHISEYERSLRSSVEDNLRESEAARLEDEKKSANDILQEILDWDEAKITENIKNRRAELEAKAEAERFHNRPENRLQDLDFWARTSTWSAEDAVLLSIGLEPSEKLRDYLEKLTDDEKMQSSSLQYLLNNQVLLQDAMDAGAIPTKANILAVVHWFAKMEIFFYPELAEKVEYFHGPISSKPKAESQQLQSADAERKSLLKLVAGMAIEGYKFDPQKPRNQATSDIEGDLDRLGIGLDQKTILKWLRQAVELVPKDTN